MFSPTSCRRCSRPQPLLTPDGLCPACTSDTPATAEPTPIAEPAPGADSSAPTVTNLPPTSESDLPTTSRAPASDTANAPTVVCAVLPNSPPGYELVRSLGGGGMGDVYLAREQPSERLVAIKFLRRPDSTDAFKRFVIELQVLAALDHPHIVRVFASDFLRSAPFFTMEYMEGGPLSAVLKSAPGGVPVADTSRLIRQVANAVAAAHAKGVIHRDLKPGNILLAPDGTPKVADFGLAKQLDRDERLTLSGALGTPSYMPPEQVSGKNGAVGVWSDVYGLGATLYHLLTGHAPFEGDSPEDIIVRMLADPPVRPRAIKPEIPLGLEAIVLKCLEKDPKDRYQTVAEFLADLDKYEAGHKPAAPPMTRARRAKRWATRNRQRIGAAVALAATTVLGVTGWVLALPSGQPAPPLRTAQVIPDEVRTPDGRLLPFRVRLGHDKSKVTATDDGTVTVSSWGLCLVEYTPAGPRPERYHLRTTVRHEASDIGGKVGVFFSHHAIPVKFGDTHLLGQVTYNDIRLAGDLANALAPPPVPIPTTDHNHVRVSAMVRGIGRERPWSGQMELASGAPFRPVGRRGDCWRNVDVCVTPEGVGGTWDGRDIGFATAARFASMFNDKLADGHKRNPDDDRLPTSARFDPKAGLGLVVENSSATFRAIELVPDKND